MSRAGHTAVIFIFSLSYCFFAHRKDQGLATPRSWVALVLSPGTGGTGRFCHSSGDVECWIFTGLPQWLDSPAAPLRSREDPGSG